MRYSILRVIDDLETRRDEFEKVVEATKQVGVLEEYLIYSGMVVGVVYAINELRKVLDDHSNV